MKCVMCNRQLDKAEFWVSGYPIGPECYKKRFGKPLHITSKVVKSEQPDLFGDDDENTAPDTSEVINP